ncbi:MAG TPA: glycosyltransferase family 2 protein [Solirubrobacteraceae bacterium]|nr:glycosyltransferase family 2 protein [Solirubrobacteraceae bacterium]
MPRVSVIVPAHDAAEHLGAAIGSVRAQTYADWEIVAVDDGSRDGTWELLQSAGPGVRALRRERPGGPAAARNLALAHADGELVAFLDADDLLLPRYLESQIRCYEAASRERRGEVGLVACDARIEIGGRSAPFTHLQRLPDCHVPLTLERVLRRNPIHVACLVPAAVGSSVGWFDTELFGTEDYGLWIKILETGHRAVLNEEVLAVYRRAPGALSADIARQGLNNRRAYELALARGRLNARQRRIARRAIRYNRAMEEVARLRFGPTGGSAAGAARRFGLWRGLAQLPLLLRVAAGNPRSWAGWLRLLRSGRADDAAELRATP